MKQNEKVANLCFGLFILSYCFNMQELEKIFKVLCLTGLKGIKQSENVFELNKTIIL